MTALALSSQARQSEDLLFTAVPRKNLIEDNGAERCGANPSYREGAELEGEVAGSCRKRGCDAD